MHGSGITEEVRPPSTLSMGERAASEGLHEVGAWGRSICSFLIPCLFPPTSAPDIRLDWETYAPDDREDRLVELLVFYGPPFPLQGQAGNDLLCSEAPEGSSSFGSPSLSTELVSSHEAVRRGAQVGWQFRCGQWALRLCEPRCHLGDRWRAAPVTQGSSRSSCRGMRECPRTTCTASAPSRW